MELEVMPRRSIGLIAVGLVLLTGFFDYLSGDEITLSVIYVLPIAIAAWYISARFAYFVATLSVVVWTAGDFANGLMVSSWLVPVWNSAIRLAFYYVVIRMLVYIRALPAQLERKVLQRTAELRSEMAERERLERELLEVSGRERRRLGYDLHDGLCQHLTGTAIAVQVLREKLKARGLPEADEAAEAVALIEQGITLSRNVAKGLQPVEMHVGGLMEALQEFAAATSQLFKANVVFECEAPILIADASVADHLYHIAREAVNNAVRHARAKRIVISLEVDDAATLLRIVDDGSGLPDPLPETQGMGLRIMRQRARLIGAELEIRSGPRHKGTEILCRLPYAHDVERSSDDRPKVPDLLGG